MPGRNMYRLKALLISISQFFTSEMSMQKTKSSGEFADEAKQISSLCHQSTEQARPLPRLRYSGQELVAYSKCQTMRYEYELPCLRSPGLCVPTTRHESLLPYLNCFDTQNRFETIQKFTPCLTENASLLCGYQLVQRSDRCFLWESDSAHKYRKLCGKNTAVWRKSSVTYSSNGLTLISRRDLLQLVLPVMYPSCCDLELQIGTHWIE